MPLEALRKEGRIEKVRRWLPLETGLSGREGAEQPTVLGDIPGEAQPRPIDNDTDSMSGRYHIHTGWLVQI